MPGGADGQGISLSPPVGISASLVVNSDSAGMDQVAPFTDAVDHKDKHLSVWFQFL